MVNLHTQIIYASSSMSFFRIHLPFASFVLPPFYFQFRNVRCDILFRWFFAGFQYTKPKVLNKTPSFRVLFISHGERQVYASDSMNNVYVIFFSASVFSCFPNHVYFHDVHFVLNIHFHGP